MPGAKSDFPQSHPEIFIDVVCDQVLPFDAPKKGKKGWFGKSSKSGSAGSGSAAGSGAFSQPQVGRAHNHPPKILDYHSHSPLSVGN
jgi:hypothetical protein